MAGVAMLLFWALLWCLSPAADTAVSQEECHGTFERGFVDFWHASGPPLAPEGSAGACSGLAGALYEVTVGCDAGFGESLSTLFMSRTEGGGGDGENLVLGRSIVLERARQLQLRPEGFRLCAPSVCSLPDGRMAAAALILYLGAGMIEGKELKKAALSLFVALEEREDPARQYMEQCLVAKASSASFSIGMKLNSGFQLPLLAYGTAGLGEQTSEMVQQALEVGFRAIDTATHPEGGEGFGYDQQGVGHALSQTTVARDSIFLITKVHPADMGYLKTIRAVERALVELGTGAKGYIDLVLVHWPTCDREYCPPSGRLRPWGDFRDAWRGLEETVARGIVRSIGVSNFDAQQLQELIAMARTPPAIAGLWADVFHPVPRALRKLCEQHSIQLQAFGVLGFEWRQGRGARGKLASPSSPLMNHPEVLAIARAKGWAVADVLVKFLLQQDIAVITSSGRPDRMRQLFSAQDSRKLTEHELQRLHDLQGFLASSLRVHASPDFYAGMVGLDTQEIHAMDSVSLPDWSCDSAREKFTKDGVVHLQKFITSAAVESAQRAAQKFLWDHGGGHLEDAESYPSALCNEADFPLLLLDSSQINYLFPVLLSLGGLARCLLDSQEPTVAYLLLRAKVRGCEASDVPWHQDTAYLQRWATRHRTYEEAKPQIETLADRSLTVHVPLTAETHDKGALMYALGSHEQGLHPKFWQTAWWQGVDPGPYEFSEGHTSVKTMETQPSDLLAHSWMVHHGTRPNLTPRIRWHLELGVQDGNYQAGHYPGHRVSFPEDTSPQSRARFLQDMTELGMSLKEPEDP